MVACIMQLQVLPNQDTVQAFALRVTMVHGQILMVNGSKLFLIQIRNLSTFFLLDVLHALM